MKKIILGTLVTLSSAILFAYNPPAGGEDLFRLTNPNMLSGSSSSVAGGPSFNVVPSSITYNPALPSNNEIITFDISGTFLHNHNKVYDGEDSSGYGFEAGVIIPTKFATWTATTNYISSEMFGMPLANIWDLHFGGSKDVLDWLSLGVNIYYRSYEWGSEDSFAIGLDAGALARVGDIAFLKDTRLGASIVNIGKPADFKTTGIDMDDECSKYPTIFTPRVGVAATLFTKGKWVGAFSADVCIPTYVTNFITSGAFEATYSEKMKLTAGFQYNLREYVEAGSDGRTSVSVGFSYKFGAKLGSKDSSITPAIATQNLYTGILAISTGVKVDLGQRDTSGAEVEMW